MIGGLLLTLKERGAVRNEKAVKKEKEAGVSFLRGEEILKLLFSV